MAFDFAELKRQTRQVVHKTLGVKAFYQDNSINTPVPISVRWHTKSAVMGDYDDQGYANTAESIDQVVFARSEARVINVKRGGRVTIDFGSGQVVVLTLATKLKVDGPYTEVWEIASDAAVFQ